MQGFNDSAWLEKEREYLQRALRGNRDAFGALYRAFAGPLYSQILMPRLGSREAAEEVLAETFQTALERLEQFQDRQVSLFFWLARIATTKAMDVHRQRVRQTRALAHFENLLGPLRVSSADPESLLEQETQRRRVRDAIARVLSAINPRYRRALELRIFDEEPRQACADAMQVTVGTFDVLVLRALRAFRGEWVAQLELEPMRGAQP